jgi:hypothetical protein
MYQVRVIQHQADACRRLMEAAPDVVVFELLKERAEDYDRQATRLLSGEPSDRRRA